MAVREFAQRRESGGRLAHLVVGGFGSLAPAHHMNLGTLQYAGQSTSSSTSYRVKSIGGFRDDTLLEAWPWSH
jgi:hypothetical protein